jgi:hypothetical protein
MSTTNKDGIIIFFNIMSETSITMEDVLTRCQMEKLPMGWRRTIVSRLEKKIDV